MATAGPPDPALHRDIGHSLAVAAAAVLLSAGLVYLLYVGRVWRTAVATRQHPPDPVAAEADTVLVFGKRLVSGAPDADYRQRLRHAHALARARPGRRLILLGGGPPGATEAEVGLATLRQLGVDGVPIELEDQSLDTLQNLRNARQLLAAERPGPVLLLSNRYHLARCARLASQLGFDHLPCAAEPRFALREQRLSRLLQEAAYLCWLEIGTGWARLIGHRRMLERVS